MQAPDDHAGQPRLAGFEGDQVADARLVRAAAVVHDQDVAAFGAVDHFEEDVGAAEVLHRPGAADDGGPLPGRCRADGGAAYLDAETQHASATCGVLRS